MNLGRSIKLCRTSLGLSQEELAKKIRVSVSYISLIEKNKRDPPISTIERLASALGVPLTVLTFLGADREDLKGVPEELREKLAGVALRLLHAKRQA
jgi:transcriptional regulator with XRE-family HTH domain